MKRLLTNDFLCLDVCSLIAGHLDHPWDQRSFRETCRLFREALPKKELVIKLTKQHILEHDLEKSMDYMLRKSSSKFQTPMGSIELWIIKCMGTQPKVSEIMIKYIKWYLDLKTYRTFRVRNRDNYYFVRYGLNTWPQSLILDLMHKMKAYLIPIQDVIKSYFTKPHKYPLGKWSRFIRGKPSLREVVKNYTDLLTSPDFTPHIHLYDYQLLYHGKQTEFIVYYPDLRKVFAKSYITFWKQHPSEYEQDVDAAWSKLNKGPYYNHIPYSQADRIALYREMERIFS
jgi:hypothetical protein